jgi:hypothetical protein
MAGENMLEASGEIRVITTGTSEPTKELFPETDLSLGLVGWDGQDDPNNPQNR